MGGLITLHLSAHHPLAGIIIMSAPAYIADWRFHILPLVKPLIRWVTPDIESDLTDPQAKECLWSYNRLPTNALVSLRQLLHLVRQELSQVQVPALIMQGVRDHHIPHETEDPAQERCRPHDARGPGYARLFGDRWRGVFSHKRMPNFCGLSCFGFTVRRIRPVRMRHHMTIFAVFQGRWAE